MQRLYVVGVTTENADTESDEPVFNRVTRHFVTHLKRTQLGLHDLLDGPGITVIRFDRADRADKHLTWTPITINDGTRALRLTIEEDLPAGGRFTCELTAAEHAGQTSFRVVMGRSSDGTLAPARVSELKPPAALKAILADPGLRCSYRGETITSSLTLALVADTPVLHQRLQDSTRRLPILVVSAMHPRGAAATLARKAAERLAGLCHVTVVSGWLALDGFNVGMEGQALPRDGARLYWPGRELRAPWWSPAALASDHDDVLGQMTRLLAPLSVVARGRDRLWDAVKNADDARLMTDLAGDKAAQIALLQQRISDEQEQHFATLEENEQLNAEIERLKLDNDNLRAQLDAGAGPVLPEPEYSPQPADVNSPDFSADWDRWTTESDGALVFTDNAKRQWDKCGYATPVQMREALGFLAELAGAWRHAKAKVKKGLVEWMAEEVGLRLALQDEGLRRAKRHQFLFEDETWDRFPHIKVNDHTKPNHVGRIYFAIDNDRYRWIVDHVGLKLYGT